MGREETAGPRGVSLASRRCRHCPTSRVRPGMQPSGNALLTFPSDIYRRDTQGPQNMDRGKQADPRIGGPEGNRRDEAERQQGEDQAETTIVWWLLYNCAGEKGNNTVHCTQNRNARTETTSSSVAAITTAALNPGSMFGFERAEKMGGLCGPGSAVCLAVSGSGVCQPPRAHFGVSLGVMERCASGQGKPGGSAGAVRWPIVPRLRWY